LISALGHGFKDLDTMAAQERIEVKTATVGCGGGDLGDPGGHPMVYLKIGGGKDGGGEITCPYCSRRYVLAAGEQNAPA
jgi:uncharacterized Zn-finger protein